MTVEFEEFSTDGVTAEVYDQWVRLEALKLAVQVKVTALSAGLPFVGTLTVADDYVKYVRTGERPEVPTT